MCTKINPCAIDVGFSELARSLLCEVSCLSLSGILVRPRQVPEVLAAKSMIINLLEVPKCTPISACAAKSMIINLLEVPKGTPISACAAKSMIFIDFHGFSLNFIDFHLFSLIFIDFH